MESRDFQVPRDRRAVQGLLEPMATLAILAAVGLQELTEQLVNQELLA